jgi:hypothetical protein
MFKTQTPTCFGPHWPVFRESTYIKRNVGPFKVQKYGSPYLPHRCALNTLKPTRCTNYVFTFYTLKNLLQFYMQGIAEGLNVWFYTTVNSLMKGQWGTKHVGVCVLKRYCYSNEICQSVWWHCNNWIKMLGMESVSRGSYIYTQPSNTPGKIALVTYWTGG